MQLFVDQTVLALRGVPLNVRNTVFSMKIMLLAHKKGKLSRNSQKPLFSDNPGQNIWQIFGIFHDSGFTTSKLKVKYLTLSTLYELPHELPNDLRLRSLGN